ncbi:MAG: hypothetical protein IJD68_08145 [Ruminococcus sp.]|nr:hypothetical protein [Ruminococcus sp.]
MKTGKVIKSADTLVSNEDLQLINQYTRRELSADEVYVFSVVLCDNDIDRDFERFTVESLFELEKLFVGKTGIFDHNPSAKNQSARIFSCKVEALENRKTKTGDDYFRLVARAYLPKSEKNKELILALDSGITKEVSVGCAVKETLCSICSQDMHTTSCHHTKGQEYNGKLCYGELTGVYDAYEFSFVAVPAQKNAGVIKAFCKNKEESKNMKDVISALKQGKEMILKSHQTEKLCDYIAQLEQRASDGEFYKAQLQNEALRLMGVTHIELDTQTLKGILEKLSVYELKSLCDAYTKKSVEEEPCSPQLECVKDEKGSKFVTEKNNQFMV